MTRIKLPGDRLGRTKKIEACGFDIYITVNFYPNAIPEDYIKLLVSGLDYPVGKPGEVFVTVAKIGSSVAGFIDTWAISTSMMFQYQIPWAVIKEKFLHHKFEPNDEKNPSLIHAITQGIDDILNSSG